MRSVELEQKYVTLTAALSWIAFRTLMDASDIKARLSSDQAAGAALEKAMQQFSVAAGDGYLKARGRHFGHIGENGLPQAGDTAEIEENSFKNFQQFDLELNRLQRLPGNGSRLLGLLSIWTVLHAPDGAAQLAKGYTAPAAESYTRAFESFAGALSGGGASLSDGFVEVEVLTDDLVREYPNIQPQRRTVSHKDVVAWCRQKIASGTNDMNAAWKDFHSLPQFAGLSRDDGFRPAWNDAKTKS